MGALCGKESATANDDPFAQPGRTLSSAPPPATRASVPKVSGPGHTLGGGTTGGGTAVGGGGGSDDARSAAAKAAEERARRANQPKGKLGRDLAAQKSKTRTGTLEEASKEVRGQRAAGERDELISYD